jgi:hypothetical protein
MTKGGGLALKSHIFFAVAVLCLPGAASAVSTIVYNNTTNLTGDLLSDSDAGDQIQLSSAVDASLAQVMFNSMTRGSFNATLSFYQLGTMTDPIGAQIGPSFTQNNVTDPGTGNFTLTFLLNGQLLPQNLIFLVDITGNNVPNDLQQVFAESPTVGSSDPSFAISGDLAGNQRGGGGNQRGGGCGTAPNTSAAYIPTACEDVYFELQGTPVVTATPEPSMLVVPGAALLAGIWQIVRRRRRSQNSAI